MSTMLREPVSVTRPRTSPHPRRQPDPVGLRPSRDDLVDAGFLTALMTLALVGFYPVFGGAGWLWAGLLGAAAGLIVAHLCAATRQLAVTTLLASVGAVLLCSGVLFGDLAVIRVLPTPSSALEALQGSLRGWHDILSVVPPVGRTGNLIAVPFSGALAAGVIGHSLARRSRRPGAAVLAPVTLLAAAILIGTSSNAVAAGDFADWPLPSPLARALDALLRSPATAIPVLQGVGLAVLGLAWATVQHQRRTTIAGSGPGPRPFATLLTLVLAATAATVGLVHLGAAQSDRVVLRDRVIPPFDPAQYGSPLAGFRAFTNTATQKDPLFTITGVPAGTTVRLATLDSYDGLVWNVADAQGQGPSASGWFQRSGSRLLTDPGIVTAPVTVTASGLRGVWVPTVADLAAARLHGPVDSGAPGDSGLFVNAGTGTLALVRGLGDGTTVHEEVALRRSVTLADVPDDVQPDDVFQGEPVLSDVVKQTALAWTEAATSDRDKVRLLADRLRTQGYYSDGAAGGDVETESGHSLRRLTAMLRGDYLLGNDEQYAAVLALMLRSLHLPARVVVGFTTPAEGAIVTGQDAHAWTEVPFPEYGWVTVTATPDRKLSTEKPKPKPQPKVQQDPVPPQVPRTDPLTPRPDEGAGGDTTPRAESLWPRIALWTALAVGGLGMLTSPLWLVLGYKAIRRRRRRTHGDPAHRISMGWREMLDLSTDLGVRPVTAGTRREQAAVMPIPGALQLATAADAATFAPDHPPDERAQGYWEHLVAERAAALARLPRRRRWRVRLSPASLRQQQ